MVSDLEMLGRRIRMIRKERNLTQEKLAEAIGVSPSNMSDIENGKANFGIEVFMKITEVLQSSPDRLLGTGRIDTTATYGDEIVKLLSDCAPADADALIAVLQTFKNTLQNAKRAIKAEY